MEEIEDGKIRFFVMVCERTRTSIGGCAGDKISEIEEFGPDFDSLEEAKQFMMECAAREKLKVFAETRYGNGKIIRDVYYVCADRYFSECEDRCFCNADGELFEGLFGDPTLACFDPLEDGHPEIEAIWRQSHRSYCRWLDHADNGMGYVSFADALADELCEDWDELDYIERKFE